MRSPSCGRRSRIRTGPGFAAIFLARSISYTALAVGLAWTVLRITRTRARLTRLASDLGEAPQPGMLRDTLAAALGDPGIEVLYPRGSGQLIDAEGRAAEPPAPDRAVARIARGERPVALVLHDPALVNEPELARALGSAAKLSVENEALRAEAMAQLHALQASRARIVETADGARRRLERDLHDGAQQRLLALSYDLRLARAGADGGTTRRSFRRWTRPPTRSRPRSRSCASLRMASTRPSSPRRGSGRRSRRSPTTHPCPWSSATCRPERPPPGVERTAYVVVDAAIEDAAGRGATWLAIRVAQDAERLVVTTDDDGPPRTARLVHLADRVGALGGSLLVGDTQLRAELPCG